MLAIEDPRAAMRRYESGEYASNEECVKAYLTVSVGGIVDQYENNNNNYVIIIAIISCSQLWL